VITAKKITPGSSGLLLSIGVSCHSPAGSPVDGFAVGLWDDNSGVPGHLLASNLMPQTSILLATSGSAGADRWLHIPLSYYLTGGTDYWIGFMVQGSGTTIVVNYDTGGSDPTITSGGWWLPDWGFYTNVGTSRNHSIRADYLS
jgi:hypothetical protein